MFLCSVDADVLLGDDDGGCDAAAACLFVLVMESSIYLHAML